MSVATRRARANRVRGRRAGLISRILAGGIDLAATAVILFGILIAFSVVRYMAGFDSLRLPKVSGIFTLAAFPVVETVYLAAAWSSTGRSVGKQVLGLRVVQGDGRGLGKARATPRAALCAAFGGPSLLWAAFSSRSAAVHDLVVRTAVVHDWSDAVRTEIPPPAPVPVPAPTDATAVVAVSR